jgi:AAA domain-containing protein
MAGLYGPSRHGKSFVALAWALCVATGRDWFGRATSKGAVIYVAAEGGRGIRKRVQAWMLDHGLSDVPDAFFVLDAVQVTDDDDLRELAERIVARGLQLKLIVFDTLARCFIGGDENSAKEMGGFVAGIARLQKFTGATVLVHHSGKGTKESKSHEIERGSSAFRAAADVMVSVSMDKDRIITVKNNKQKDDEEFQPMKLRLEQVPVGSGFDQTTSCVLRLEGRVLARAQTLPLHLRMTLEALASCPNGEASIHQWRARTLSTERTIHTHRRELAEKGLVEARQPKGHYAITEKGRLALSGTAATATRLQPGNSSSGPIPTAATATPPIGVAGAARAARLTAHRFGKAPVDDDEVVQ